MPLPRRTLLALAAATASRPAAAQSTMQSTRLRIGTAAPNTAMDPHLNNDAPNNAVNNHVYEALILNSEASRSLPGLALTWRPLDDTHWTLALRPGVRFSDGSPFTAADAIASIRRAAELPNAIGIRTYTRSVKAMSAPDPMTLLIETTGPDPMLPNSLSRIRIIPEAQCGATTADFNAGRAAIGTGPYRLATFVNGSHTSLTRNDGWWGTPPPWTEVSLRIVTDPGSRLASLLAGDLDLIESVPAQGADRVKADPRFHLIRGISSRMVYVGMDSARPTTPFVAGSDGKPLDRNPLQDRRVRQALGLAINRQALTERVMDGNAVIASQFLPKGAPGTSDALDLPVYDPARATALLAEAGYPKGFRLTLHGPNNRYVNDGRLVQAIGQMFTRIGVETTVELLPWTVYAPRATNHEFSVFLGAWGANTGETSNPLSALVATIDKPAGLGIANDGAYSNPEADALLKKALRTMDEAPRNALLGQASAIVIRDAALLPLHHEVTVWGARRELTYATRADQYTLATGVGRAA